MHACMYACTYACMYVGVLKCVYLSLSLYIYPPPCRRHSCVYNVHAVLQSSSPPVFLSSSFPVLQSSSFPDPVPVGVGVWRSFLETHSGESILRGVQGGSLLTPAWIPTPQEEPPAPKFAYLASSWRSCALSWHQDATASPKISKKTPSWSQHLPT